MNVDVLRWSNVNVQWRLFMCFDEAFWNLIAMIMHCECFLLWWSILNADVRWWSIENVDVVWWITLNVDVLWWSTVNIYELWRSIWVEMSYDEALWISLCYDEALGMLMCMTKNCECYGFLTSNENAEVFDKNCECWYAKMKHFKFLCITK